MKNNNFPNYYDKKIWNYINKEISRQENNIQLIASENYTSPSIMKAQGSHLTNKYAEGYSNKRYYGGCKYIDKIESIAINRAKKLFNADYANVQPHSGSQANFAVYLALLKPGDIILGMDLSHGGHLTHGSSVNFSGILYKSISYQLDKKGNINYKQLLQLSQKYHPQMIIGGFSSFSGIVDWKKIRKIANTINAYFVVDIAHIAGLIAANLYPNPIEYADVVTSTTHKTLCGPRGGLILSKNKDDIFYKKLNSAVFPGSQGGPLMHIIAAKAIAFKEAMQPSYKIYQKQVIKNAQIMAQIFIQSNFKIISGKTHNHLLLIDLSNKKLTGKDIENSLSLANIIVNKNAVPNDIHSPFITSGIRIGTPSITRRGFKKLECINITKWIIKIINNHNNINIILKIKKQVLKLCKNFPVYK